MKPISFDHHHQITTPKQRLRLSQAGKYLIELTQPDSSVAVFGAFELDDQDHRHIELVIHHQAPRTQASAILKGVVNDQAMLRFVGKIIIDPNCSQVNSFLTERVLLLSPKAKAETVPNLEIKTADVKCSHAVSISSISEQEIFYLRSRGLTRRQAEEMIVQGFLAKPSQEEFQFMDLDLPSKC